MRRRAPHAPLWVSECVIVIAASGRMIAEACHQSGIASWVIERYPSADTAQFAERTACPSQWNHHTLRDCLHRWDPRQTMPIVYGSPLDDNDQLSDLIGKRLTQGTQPENLHSLQHPQKFFSLLAQHRIPHPPVSFIKPHESGWLIKDMRRSGGEGIQHNTPAMTATSASQYYQKCVSGEAYGFSFIAHTDGIHPIGYNRIITHDVSPFPMRLHALEEVSPSTLSSSIRHTMKHWAACLSQDQQWRGICTMDVMIHNDAALLLEVNARPGHNLDIHGTRAPLMRWHREASENRPLFSSPLRHLFPSPLRHLFPLPLRHLFPSPLRHLSSRRAMIILYADDTHAVTRPYDMAFVKDQPLVPSVMARGEPLCTIHAAHPSKPYEKALGYLDLMMKKLHDETLTP